MTEKQAQFEAEISKKTYLSTLWEKFLGHFVLKAVAYFISIFRTITAREENIITKHIRLFARIKGRVSFLFKPFLSVFE